jgi:hypothetical protein
MVVLPSWVRNRWKARFEHSKGRVSYPPGSGGALPRLSGALAGADAEPADCHPPWRNLRGSMRIRQCATRRATTRGSFTSTIGPDATSCRFSVTSSCGH